MSNPRWLSLGFTLGVLLAVAPSCGIFPFLSPAKTCSASNCTGCCDAKSVCQVGTTAEACGLSGAACHVCGTGSSCSANVCSATPAGTGGSTGSGGGTGTGGNTGAGGGTGSCANGCLASNGQCILPPNNTFDAFCGTGGGRCADCTLTGATCASLSCVGGSTGGGSGGGTGTGGGTGGGAGASVGTACTTASQCAGLGSGAFCKLKSPSGWAYPQGFCSLPCGAGSCPSGAECTGMPSSYAYLYGETAPFCVPGCTAAGAACGISGLVCEDSVGDLSAPATPGCWLDMNVSDPAALPPFTGGGTPNKLGQACTSSTTCSTPPDKVLAFCYPGTMPDGGVSGFTGGYCMADCNADNTGAFCGTNGWCLGVFQNADGTPNYQCIARCGSPGSGRLSTTTGSRLRDYVCRTLTSTDGGVAGGYQWPSCNAPGRGCTAAPYTTCNSTTGYCCNPSNSSDCRK